MGAGIPRTPEKQLQFAAASYLESLERYGLLTFYHPANEGKRSRNHNFTLKAAGTKRGQPDLEIFVPGGRTIFIELKAMDGDLEKHQAERHSVLSRLGFHVYTIFAETRAHAVSQIEKILKQEGVRI